MSPPEERAVEHAAHPAPSSHGSTLDRLIRILDAFESDRPVLQVAALARRANLPLPTAYRWVDRLVGSGLLQRHEDGTVGPGLRLWELAARSAPTTSLRDAARPFMDDVQAVLRQHTQLALLDEDGVLIIERLSARGAVANQASVAGRLPTFTTALGLVLLAHSRRHVTEAFLASHQDALGQPLVWSTGHDVGSARGVVNPTEAVLRQQIAEVRRLGYAALDGQVDDETTGVAVPILGGDGSMLAALGVVVPRHSDLAPGLAPMLLAAARGVSRALAVQPSALPDTPRHDSH